MYDGGYALEEPESPDELEWLREDTIQGEPLVFAATLGSSNHLLWYC
jgi:hypothetical protein